MSPTSKTGIGMTSQRTRDRLAARLQDKGITDNQVLSAIRSTPRHLFVDEALASRAYEDTALPIGYGQTISQPYIVAKMTEVLLANSPAQSVLEVGTGSGYQAALLAQLVNKVYTVERIRELFNQSRDRLRKLSYRNIRFKWSDGSWGWQEYAPYDAIMVTAAAQEIPESLQQQLKVGGCMVLPLGASGGAQQLLLVKRTASQFERHMLETVYFVPLIQGPDPSVA